MFNPEKKGRSEKDEQSEAYEGTLKMGLHSADMEELAGMLESDITDEDILRIATELKNRKDTGAIDDEEYQEIIENAPLLVKETILGYAVPAADKPMGNENE